MLTTSNFTFCEMHLLCLAIVIALYVSTKLNSRKEERRTNFNLIVIYFCCSLLIASDAVWNILSSLGTAPAWLSYPVNMVYYIAGIVALLYWLAFCLSYLELEIRNSTMFNVAVMLPATLHVLLVLTTAYTGALFTIEDGVYVRGFFFLFSPALNLLYILFSTILSFAVGRKKQRLYDRKKAYALSVYGIPIIISALLQALTGQDFFCIGLTIGFILLYVMGISSTTREDSGLIYSLSRSFDAAFKVDMDTHAIRTLRMSPDFDSAIYRVPDATTYEARIQNDLDFNVVPEDRYYVSENFDMENIKKRLSQDVSFNVVYRVKTQNNEILHHKAIFLLAEGLDGKSEFLFGIQNVNLEKVVSERTIELAEKNERLERINEEIIATAANLVEARDSESGEHIIRVKEYTYLLAVLVMNDYPEYNLTPEKVRNITSASALHDIGKIAIPDAILLKPDVLTVEEFDIMKTHSARGCDMLRNFAVDLSETYMQFANEICRWHHEKYDGGGYPDGLVGDEIPISAQIVSVADCLDALMAKRVYKASYSPDQAIDMILSGQCGAFSDKILRCLRSSRKQIKKIAANPTISAYEHGTPGLDTNTLLDLEILLVDDSELDRKINKDILEDQGAKVTEAVNGTDAIKAFKGMASHDAVIMDIYMPEMDGFEAVQELRKLEKDSADKTPIIILTGSSSPDTINKILAEGADACMTKPLVISRLAGILISGIRERSISMEKKLADSIRQANTDALTRVKNVTAYSAAINELEAETQSSLKPAFAIVMCDINNLKNVNDNYGHSIGDVYINNNCRIICQVFSHSPVFRIGGDEFVVILKGYDYQSRAEKMQELKKRIDEAEQINTYEEGKASLAAGISVFNPEENVSVNEVIRHADKAMYANKMLMKGSVR